MPIDRWILEELEQRRRLIERVSRPILGEIEHLKFDHLDHLRVALEPTRQILDQFSDRQQALDALAPTIASARQLAETAAQWDAAARTLRSNEDRFVLPRSSQIQELTRSLAEKAEIIRNGFSPLDIARKMERMETPWLNPGNPLWSATAFAELQTLGATITRSGAFEHNAVSLLRTELGDWRGVSVPEAILTDPLARHGFYRDLGFNEALTSFPLNAFNQGADFAGLALPNVEPSWEHSAPDEDEEPAAEGLELNTKAYRVLFVLETRIRAFIARAMADAHGDLWIAHHIPGDIRQKWQEKQRKALDSGEPKRPLIAYADFTDYIQIIERRDNWNTVFKQIFQRKEDVRESFVRLFPIRLCTMHARPVTLDDELLLRAESRRLLRAIGILK